MHIDRTNLAYWFPLVKTAGLPVPETVIVEMTTEQMQLLAGLFFDDTEGSGEARKALADFEASLITASEPFAEPFFLRTGHTSGKHHWDRTCRVTDRKHLAKHVFALAEFSEMVDLIGIPWRTWVIREMLPIKPVAHCPRYGNMPVNREFRVFVDGPKVECFHPYWPKGALDDGLARIWDKDYQRLCDLQSPDLEHVLGLASDAGKAVGGRWSVDLLDTERGWFLTDMAEAEKSFHWEGCANGRE